MPLEIKKFCPLGHKACEYAEDGVIHRCEWYEHLVGKNPQSEELLDEWKCSIPWLVIMAAEIAQTNRGQTRAIELFRNEVSDPAKAIAHASISQAQAMEQFSKGVIRLASMPSVKQVE